MRFVFHFVFPVTTLGLLAACNVLDPRSAVIAAHDRLTATRPAPVIAPSVGLGDGLGAGLYTRTTPLADSSTHADPLGTKPD